MDISATKYLSIGGTAERCLIMFPLVYSRIRGNGIRFRMKNLAWTAVKQQKLGRIRAWHRHRSEPGLEQTALAQIRKMGRKQLIEAAASYPWWHSIDLGDGVVTPGVKSLHLMQSEFATVFSSINLNNKSVLDLGAWNGGFSIEAHRRGAARVVAVDHCTWNDQHFKGRETFEIACRATGMEIETMDIDLDQPKLDLTHLGQFDVVLFLGVFYHLKNPISALMQVVPLARETLVLETHIEDGPDPRPLMIFYPGAELSGDASNWWGPNRACVIELLKFGGFSRIDVSPGSSPLRQVFHARRSG